MKMKRFFKNRNKRKKSNGGSDTIYDSNVAEITSSDVSTDTFNATKSSKKKKQRQRKKKLKAQKSTDSDSHTYNSSVSDNSHSYLTVNHSNVVLRRDLNALSHVQSTAGTETCRDGDRIPGSESSSRTPSSASSQSVSQRRWSARRPWSLVETLREQSLAESQDKTVTNFTGEYKSDPSNISVPLGVCTLPRGTGFSESSMTLNSTTSGKERRPRTFTLDFNFFRRVRKHSESKTRPGSTPLQEASTESRSSFRLKNLISKNYKEKRRNLHDVVQRSSESTRSSTSSATFSSLSDFDMAGRLPVSACDSVTFDLKEASIPEEQGCSAVVVPSTSQSPVTQSFLEATTSNGTSSVIGQSDSLNTIPSLNSSRRSLYQCSQSDGTCNLNSNESIGRCNCASFGSGISILDTDRALPRRNNRLKRNQKTRKTYLAPTSITSTYSASTGDLYRASAVPAITKNARTIFGGSMLCVSSTAPPPHMTSQTLPRRSGVDMVRLQESAKETENIYASSPQLSDICCRTLAAAEAGATTRSRSSTVRFSDCFNEGAPEENYRMRSPSMTLLPVTERKSDQQVGSPIKRAIAYPGVILRRHQNRRNQKNQERKALSGEISTTERRAKYAMSLNVEDLPTYDQMRQNELRWRSSSLYPEDNLHPDFRLTRRSITAGGHERLRAALYYQRLASQCASIDDVNTVNFLLGEGQSIEDLTNMDEDEFANFCLTVGSNGAPSRKPTRSSLNQEPSSKRVKILRKSVASFANLISPGKPGKSSRIQRSSSFKDSATPTVKPYRPPGSVNSGGHGTVAGIGSGQTPGRRSVTTKTRRSKLWCETFDHTGLDEAEVKRQEAIYELYQGECVMVQDLKMAKQTYRDSMVTLKMLTEDEVTRIFGTLDCLLPLHEDLLARLEKGRTAGGRTDGVGNVFIDWFPTLSPYNEYCANQADAKETLDSVVGRKRVRDFLQRCLESPFSRKLDLWSYLDLPRSRLVKYPLLLKNILKATPSHHSDAALLENALTIINDIIVRVDDITGERQFKFVQSKLEYLDEKHKCSEVEESRNVMCSGQLKGSRGTKLHVFIFDLALVLTRNATRNDRLTYQVYRQPLPLKSLVVETEEAGKLSGSFRGSILNNDKAKHSFRVRSEDSNTSYTLIATDEHDKKQWVNSLQDAITKCRAKIGQSSPTESPIACRSGSAKLRLGKSHEKSSSIKRSSSVKSERGSPNPWYRNRSMTVNGQPSLRRNSKEKEGISGDFKKKSRSPLSFRRNSSKYATSKTDSSESLDIKSDVKISPLATESFTQRRSRSLTNSPITFLANLPKRNNGSSRLSRSESCTTKPPSGRVSQLAHCYNLRSLSDDTSRSFSKLSTRLYPAISTPDLSAVDSTPVSRKCDPMETLDEVKKRLAPVSNKPKSEIKVSIQTPTPRSSLTSSPEVDLSSYADEVDQDRTAVTNTCQKISSRKENSVSSLHDPLLSTSMHASSSSPTFAFVSTASDITSSVTWQKTSSELSLTAIDETMPTQNKMIESISCFTSSESLGEVMPLMDDVDAILDNVVDAVARDDVNTTDFITSTSIDAIVMDILSDIIDSVSNSQPAAPYSGEMRVTCHDGDFIIITAHDGLPWRGNDIEMTV